MVPYISTNWKVSGSMNNAFSLNLLAGYAGGVRGFELGGLVNIDRNHVRGVQVAGLGNIVGKRTSGFQLSGLCNVDLGRFYGCQVSGLFNWVAVLWNNAHHSPLEGTFYHKRSRRGEKQFP